jgi:Zn-dependent protease
VTTSTLSLSDPELQPDSIASKRVRRELRRPAVGGGFWLIASLALFVLSQAGGQLADVVVLVAVLFFHETGHYVAMRAFGYRDLKIFFVPFLGAAVSGKRTGVAAWKEAVVSLAGPMPGIVIGCALAFGVRVPAGATKTIGLSLLLINAFNLLPLGGLDGGRLFQRILFSRHRLVEIAFQGVAGAALALLAIELKTWALGFFAFLGIATLPFRARLLTEARRLRADLAGVTDARSLDGPRWTQLFEAARRVAGSRRPPTPRMVARTMEAMVQALQPPPSAAATVALAATWLAGVGLGVVGTLVLVWHAPPQYWHTRELADTGLTVEMPYRPKTTSPPPIEHAQGIVQLESGSRHSFAVSVWSIDEDYDGTLAQLPGAGERLPVSMGSFRGEEVRYAAGDRACKQRSLRSNRWLVVLQACAPRAEPEIDRFVRSLREQTPDR